MNMWSWRMAVVKDYRSMLKTVFTVKPVISRTPVRTSTGCVPREGKDQPTMECEQSDHLTTTTAVVSQSLHLCEQVFFLLQYRFLCVIFFLLQ